MGREDPKPVDDEIPDIDVKISRAQLARRVREERERLRDQNAQLEKVVTPRVDSHIAACRTVLDQLEGWHAEIAETTNLDPKGYSRGAAVWLVAGRCLGLMEVMLIQAEASVDNEGIIVGRALHEANRILMAFCADPDDQELVRLWLDDKGKHGYVKAGAARDANNRFEEKLNEALADKGMSAPGTTMALSIELYDRLSRTVHSRRSSCLSSYWEEGRSMAYGRAPNQVRRANSVEWASQMNVETAEAVGDAFRAFYGQGFFLARIVPLVEGIWSEQKRSPLDEASLVEAAGLDC